MISQTDGMRRLLAFADLSACGGVSPRVSAKTNAVWPRTTPRTGALRSRKIRILWPKRRWKRLTAAPFPAVNGQPSSLPRSADALRPKTDATLNPRATAFPCKQISPQTSQVNNCPTGNPCREGRGGATPAPSENYAPSTPILRPSGTDSEQSRGRSLTLPPRPRRACTARGSRTAAGLSSKPVRRRSPTLGRFDSCAAPLNRIAHKRAGFRRNASSSACTPAC